MRNNRHRSRPTKDKKEKFNMVSNRGQLNKSFTEGKTEVPNVIRIATTKGEILVSVSNQLFKAVQYEELDVSERLCRICKTDDVNIMSSHKVFTI